MMKQELHMKSYRNQHMRYICSFAFNKAVSVSAGYTFMKGSETMEVLNQISEKRRLHWAWLMLSIKPTLFHTTWQDKE